MNTLRTVFCLLALAGATDGRAEPGALSMALQALRMTPADLGFKKDVADAVFVTGMARHCLAEPLALPSLATRSRAELARHESLADVAAWCRDRLELPWREVPVAPRQRLELPPLPAAVATAVQTIYDATVAVQPLLPEFDKAAWEAFAVQTFSSRDCRRRYAPGLAARAEALELQDDESAQAVLDAAERVDRAALLAAFWRLCAAVDVAVAELQGQRFTEAFEVRVETRLGPIYIGGAGPNAYSNAALLILDLGGDDQYQMTETRPVSITLDLAGNDRYEGAAAAGVFGVGLLVDCAGDDIYRGEHVTQGAGVFGCGLLADFGGSDSLQADTFAQGAGFFGAGVVWQRGGETQYCIAQSGQGYGRTGGVGLLLEVNGSDSYVAGGKYPCRWLEGRFFSLAQGMGMGMRPFAGGGLGVLCDLAGNDRYRADVYGQGASYWYSVGMLLDGAGNDRYEMDQYGQGAGIHLSSGILMDWAGNDTYTARAICQGGAHDYSVGLLVDQRGNDRYTARSTAQGSAINNSFALLVDERGDDRYTGTDPKQSQAAGHDGGWREYGSIAVLLDLGGDDRYSQGWHNNSLWTKPHHGVGLDGEWRRGTAGGVSREGWKPVVSVPVERRRYRPVDVRHPLERLLRRSVQDGETDEEVADAKAAEAETEERAPEMLAYLLTRLDTPNVLVWVKAEQLADRLRTNAVPLLLEALRTASDDDTARGCCFWLARFEPSPAGIAAVLPLLPRDKLRATALYTLGHWRAKAVFEPAVAALTDEREIVRLRAVQALGRLGDARALPHLERMTKDPLWHVRFAAETALANIKKGN